MKMITSASIKSGYADYITRLILAVIIPLRIHFAPFNDYIAKHSNNKQSQKDVDLGAGT